MELTVACDFGTSRSGYAYCVGSYDPQTITVEDEFDGEPVGRGKLPTAVCLNRDGSFRSFGITAFRDYFHPPHANLGLQLYMGFKMLLYHGGAPNWKSEPPKAPAPEKTNDLSKACGFDAFSSASIATQNIAVRTEGAHLGTCDSLIPESKGSLDSRIPGCACGTSLGDLKVTSIDGCYQARLQDLIAWTLGALAAYACERFIRLRRTPTRQNIRWVISVPAIWSPEAKDVMRAAAKQANFFDDEDAQFMLCLESEATALSILRFQKDERVLIVDAGGGTVDCTVQQVKAEPPPVRSSAEKFGDVATYKLSEVLISSGGAWGSTYIDANFIAFFNRLFGSDLVQAYKREHSAHWWRILENFEALKNCELGTNPTALSTVILELPSSFGSFVQRFSGKSVAEMCAVYNSTSARVSSKSTTAPAAATTTTTTTPAATGVVTSWWNSLFGSRAPPPPKEDVPTELTKSVCKESNIATSSTKDEPVVTGDTAWLQLSRDLLESFARPVVQRTLDHVLSLCNQLIETKQWVQHIVLAGGLAECKMLSQGVKNIVTELGKRSIGSLGATSNAAASVVETGRAPMLHLPGRAATSVMMGAVRYGLDPTMICERIMPAHYGIRTGIPIEHCTMAQAADFFRHPDARIQRTPKGTDTRDIFWCVWEWLTEKGKSYPIGHIVDVYLQPISDNAKRVWMHFYKTQDRTGKLFLKDGDPDVTHLGVISLPLERASCSLLPTQRTIHVAVRFSTAEFEAAACDLTWANVADRRYIGGTSGPEPQAPWAKDPWNNAAYQRLRMSYSQSDHHPDDDLKDLKETSSVASPKPKEIVITLSPDTVEALSIYKSTLEIWTVGQQLGAAKLPWIGTDGEAKSKHDQSKSHEAAACVTTLPLSSMPSYLMLLAKTEQAKMHSVIIYRVTAPETECVPIAPSPLNMEICRAFGSCVDASFACTY